MPKIDHKNFYYTALKKHGITAQGLNWNNSKNQEIRFEQIRTLLPKNLSYLSITDVGCGFGDFYKHLLLKHQKPDKYIGIDILDAMCKIAKKRTAQTIICADATKDKFPETSYIVCSGTINTLTKFEAHQLIYNCYDTCKDGFIFNSLHGQKISQIYNYFSTKEIEEIAKEMDVKRVVFKDNYLKNDITVAFYKEN